MNYDDLLGLTSNDRKDMLQALDLSSTDELFDVIPQELRLSQALDLPSATPEWDLRRLVLSRARKNLDAISHDTYLGAGCYDHHVPAVIDAVANRSEFLTAYTPYQPEMSQGLLAALYEFTTKMQDLVDLPVVTSSHYDGATALAEACWMAACAKKRNTILVSSALLPQYRKILDNYNWGRGLNIVELHTDTLSGRTEMPAELVDDVAAVVVQSPNAFGVLEDFALFSQIAQNHDSLLIGAVHPFLTALGTPLGQLGFDIVVLEGQALGMHMFAGGAHLGILACTDALRALTPGRLIGHVSDINGKPALALVFEDREQHVARDRATSNICSNQAINALRAGAYLALNGASNVAKTGRICQRSAGALRKACSLIDGITLSYTGPIFLEFVMSFQDATTRKHVVDNMLAQNLFAGVAVDKHDGLNDKQLLVSVTETKSPALLERYVIALCAALSCDDAAALAALRSALDVELEGERVPLEQHPNLQPTTEIALVRRYTGFSRDNYGVDTGSYPLGSCTMKYNPKRNDAMTEITHFQALHPLQPVQTMSGLKEIYTELQSHIATLIGMDAVDLTPAAGAHGELKGLLIARQYFADQRQTQRTEVIIPDSAHGTNPASASMVGFTCKIIPTRADGLMDLAALKAALSDKTALVMTTNPSTFGLFEEDILEIVESTHKAGALLYYDGANMNALMGHATPGGMGFDISHINVHKTLSTPHGGGGPGAGPVGVKAFLKPYISAGFTEDSFEHGPLQTKLFFGHISVLLRAYIYIRSMGPDGLRQATSDAVLNANYLMHRLRSVLPPAFDKTCMHEVLLDGSKLPITTLDLSKRMIDFGIHPPTLVGAGCVYFGEKLSQAMLFEPTESESKMELDAIADTIIRITQEALEDKTIAQSAPHVTPVARLVL